jgi:hypothetical protein
LIFQLISLFLFLNKMFLSFWEETIFRSL